MAMVKDDILDITMGKVPMLKVLLLYVMGILFADVSNSFLSPKLLSMAIGFLIFSYLILGHIKGLSKKYTFTVCFSAIVIIYGCYEYSLLQVKNIKNHYSNYSAVQYKGIVNDEPIYKEKTIRFPVKLQLAIDSSQSKYVEGKVMVTVLRDSHQQSYNYGDEIVFVNKLKTVNAPFNPKEFDYKTYLANKGIEEQCLLNVREIKILNR